MFSNAYQSGFLSIFYSVGSNPLTLWDKQVKNGHIRRVVDDEVKSLVLELGGTNVATTYITCPIQPRASLGVKLPFLVMIIKNMKKYFTFEIQILDDKDMHRRFRVSNFQSTTKVRPFCTTMPIGLSSGWNQVQFNLADFTKRAYGSTYMETMRVQLHANVRVRRIYFSDALYSDDELPNEFKLFAPMGKKDEAKPPEVLPIEIRKSGERIEEMPPPPTPADDLTVKVDEGAAEEAPSPAAEPIEAPAEAKEEAAEHGEGEGAPAEAPAEGAVEGAAAEEGAPPAEGEAPAEGAPPAEGEEGAPPTEESQEPTATEEPTTTEEPSTEAATTEEPASTTEEAPTEAPTAEE